MLISPAYAQDASNLMSSASQFVPLILIFVVFYVLMIRPQQTRAKQLKLMLTQLKRGDRVVTAGGIIGTISRVLPDRDGKPMNEIEVEIASGIKVMVLRETISNVVNPTPANDTKPAKT